MCTANAARIRAVTGSTIGRTSATMLEARHIMFWATAGAINAFLSVACGAFGAHALKRRLDADRLAVFETGARYHMYHALALLGVGWLASTRGGAADLVGALFLAGIALFSGSLYALALSGVRKLGAITPLGGLCFLLGWIDFAWVAMSSP
jgi:uncharacterized membrane protein YgdD (TMEM256/DUF423 family)